MTLEQALLVAISSLTAAFLALWRKSVKDEEVCRLDIKELHAKISDIWKELHSESIRVMQKMIEVTVEHTHVLNALHKRIDRLDILRMVDEEAGNVQSQDVRERK